MKNVQFLAFVLVVPSAPVPVVLTVVVVVSGASDAADCVLVHFVRVVSVHLCVAVSVVHK